MANPQKKNGYTGVANEIFEQISKTNLNGTQFRIVITLWRYTYGFNRKQHEMSINFIAKAIEASRSQVDRELQALIDRNIITVIKMGPRKARVMMFNKNYEEWCDRPLNRGQSSLSANPSTKKENIKDINKKNTRHQKKYDEESTFFKMAKYFHERVTSVAKEAGVEHLTKKANLQKWSDDFRKLVEIDKVEDKKQILAVMDWVSTDDFWKTNVLSAKKFREKFAELAIKMATSKSKVTKPKQTDPRDKELEFQQWVDEGKDPDEFDWRK